MHMVVPMRVCVCVQQRKGNKGRETEERGFYQWCSYQHQYASSLKQPTADVMGDLFKIRPATSVTDQSRKRHRHTNVTSISSNSFFFFPCTSHLSVCTFL